MQTGVPRPAHEDRGDAGRGDDAGRDDLIARYAEVRNFTKRLTDGLVPEDMVVQSTEDVSPTKWHLAHTSWFFEQFVLIPYLPGYEPFHPEYLYLFNSYYHQAGERHCRDQRGYISRPTVAEVLTYRYHVDAAMLGLLETPGADHRSAIEELTVLGLNHEQQHQELLLTDIKHVFAVNPLRPVYREQHGENLPRESPPRESPEAGPRTPVQPETDGGPPLEWVGFEGGVHEVGHAGEGFAYDNEGPRHRAFLEPFELATRLVTNGEYLRFVEAGGYSRAELWLSLGWDAVVENGWTEPFYWERRDGRWMLFSLSGMRDLDPAEPVCHLNYFEADAFARWAAARLPTEAEWEVAAMTVPVEGNFVEAGLWHPAQARDPARDVTASGVRPGPELQQMFGDVWEWTASPYTPYPGFRPAAGAIGEYNGKFMCNQYVLRGGSCATSRSHIRPSYRNFFPAEASWQFTGLRLARDPTAGHRPG